MCFVYFILLLILCEVKKILNYNNFNLISIIRYCIIYIYNKREEISIMSVELCKSCGSPIKKLKHSIICQCGSKIISSYTKVSKYFGTVH